MKNQSKEQIARIRSMMERIENPHNVLSEAMTREHNLINEATAGVRKQVTRDEFIDLMNTVANDPKCKGKFASITLVKGGDVYKTKKTWRPDDVQKSLDAHADLSDKEWYQNLNAYNQPDVKGDNPLYALIVTQRYVFHWQSLKDYNSQYAQYADARTNLRLQYGLSQMQGDAHNIHQKTDHDVDLAQDGQDIVLNFNMAGVTPTVTAYLVDGSGNVVDEIPNDIRGAMKALPNPYKAEKEARDTLSGEILDEYTRLRKELDATWQTREFKGDKILTMCFAVDGVSYYYINDNVQVPISKDAGVMVNAGDLVKMAKEQLGETFDVMQGFAN